MNIKNEVVKISELKIGGIGFKRYKDLANALVDSRMGDSLILKQDEEIKSTGKIETSVVIEGGNRTITVPKNGVGLILSNGAKTTIRDLTVHLEQKSNFIFTEEQFKGELILENVEFVFDKRTDPRDWYSPIAGQSTEYQLTLNHVSSPYFAVLANSIKLQNSRLGNLFGLRSQLLTTDLSVDQSSLHHTLLQSLYENSTGVTFINQLDSYGELFISQMSGSINGLTFKEALNRKEQPFTKEKEFKKAFLNESFIKENNLFNLFSGMQLDEFKISNVVFEDKETDIYEAYGFNFKDSDVTIQNTKIPFFKYKNVITDSTIRFENVDDKSQWTKNGEVTTSNLNSKSELLQQGNKGNKPSKRPKNALEEMNQYIGLANVKKQMKQLVSLASMNAERKQRGLPETQGFSMHMVFSGSAGTGKTTMAKLLGKALYENGILPTNKFVVATRKDLVAGYIGQTADKTHQLIESAKGGVLFIDEAYSLTPKGDRDFANEAVDQLVMDAEEYRDDTVIILAGYTNEMKHFINTANTGLPSRFKNWIEFPDYTLKELVQILFMVLNQQGAILGKTEKKALIESFKRIYDTKTQNGNSELNGNARFVRNYVQDLIMAKDSRVSTLQMENVSDRDLMRILLNDIEAIEPKYL